VDYLKNKQETNGSVTQNVGVATAYVQALVERGAGVFVRNDAGQQLPVEGITYDPGDTCYSAAVTVAERTVHWPLDATTELRLAQQGPCRQSAPSTPNASIQPLASAPVQTTFPQFEA
jgi:hypothetical protein